MRVLTASIFFTFIFTFSIFARAETCVDQTDSLTDYDLILEDVQIWSASAEHTMNAHIAVRGDKIAGVFLECELPFTISEDKKHSLGGRAIAPGFQDFHIHNDGFQYSPTGTDDDQPGVTAMAKRMLYSGITSYLDLGSNAEITMPFRDHSRNHEAKALPTVYATGGVFQIKGGHASKSVAVNVDNPEHARSTLGAHIRKWKPDMIKLVYDHNFHRPNHANGFVRMEREMLLALVETAQRHNVKVVAHVGTWDDVRETVAAGVSAVTHIPYGDLPNDIIPLLKSHNISLITTMVAYMDLGFMQEPEKQADIFEHALLKAVALKNLILSYFDFQKYTDGSKSWTTWAIEHNAIGYRQRSFKKLIDGGVNIIAGTDSSLDGVFFGYSYHRELKLMVEFGATPAQALKTATMNAEKLLNHGRGQLKVGAYADIVVFDHSPYEDINNSTAIHSILKNGQWLDLEQLKNELGVTP